MSGGRRVRRSGRDTAASTALDRTVATRSEDALFADIVALQRFAGNRRTASFLAGPTGAVQRVSHGKKKPKKQGPKSLKYHGNPHKANRRKTKLRRFKLHDRHIIPHSDLQSWMWKAREHGDAASDPGRMRLIIFNLLGTLGEAQAAADWAQACAQYQNAVANGETRSLLQVNQVACTNVWGTIEWHTNNLVRANGDINRAIQNRFDAVGHWQPLFPLWHAASGLLGLNPQQVQQTLVPTMDYEIGADNKPTVVRGSMTVLAAAHDNSRPMIPIWGARVRAV